MIKRPGCIRLERVSGLHELITSRQTPLRQVSFTTWYPILPRRRLWQRSQRHTALIRQRLHGLGACRIDTWEAQITLDTVADDHRIVSRAVPTWRCDGKVLEDDILAHRIGVRTAG